MTTFDSCISGLRLHREAWSIVMTHFVLAEISLLLNEIWIMCLQLNSVVSD